MKKLFSFMLITVVIASCSNLKKINTSALKLGMNKEQVAMALKKKADNILSSAYNDQGQKVEIVSYSEKDMGYVADRYLLVFLDDALVEWKVSPIGRKADIIIDQTIHNK